MGARENILNKIQSALESPVPLPFPDRAMEGSLVTTPSVKNEALFAEEFSKLGGKLIETQQSNWVNEFQQLMKANNWTKIYCTEEHLANSLKNAGIRLHNDLASCEASITSCECLVARTGSIMLSSALPQGRTASVYAPVHVCVAHESRLVFDIDDALQLLTEKYNGQLPSFITFATGPSRTADIEKTLVTGVHGPKEVYCLLLQD